VLVALVKQAVMQTHRLPQTLVAILYLARLHLLAVVAAVQDMAAMTLTQMVKVAVPAVEVLLTLIQHM
jgi:hypothetical protein